MKNSLWEKKYLQPKVSKDRIGTSGNLSLCGILRIGIERKRRKKCYVRRGRRRRMLKVGSRLGWSSLWIERNSGSQGGGGADGRTYVRGRNIWHSIKNRDFSVENIFLRDTVTRRRLSWKWLSHFSFTSLSFLLFSSSFCVPCCWFQTEMMMMMMEKSLSDVLKKSVY